MCCSSSERHSYCTIALLHVRVYVFLQAEDGIRDLVRSRGLGDVYKRQVLAPLNVHGAAIVLLNHQGVLGQQLHIRVGQRIACLLYTSDAADERSSVDLGGRRIIKKKNT